MIWGILSTLLVYLSFEDIRSHQVPTWGIVVLSCTFISLWHDAGSLCAASLLAFFLRIFTHNKIGLADEIFLFVAAPTLSLEVLPLFWIMSGFLGALVYFGGCNPIPFIPVLAVSWGCSLCL